ncbi:RNA polymerase sigma70 factor [Kitasatospora cheerisanensis KCTC 2395]|uniref:RNA polymerase sigma70 factor n=1 Tax=Kitasatospora cheerisanensis KCTC 2395 TaxID=1348663 RepID=A0A066Z7B2_9ACTN|nr:RNA polymerase sigma70 factor [Kitasatospora cheerisanensis KCTC 2395]
MSALQKLPARQRAVLILREVLAWSAAETAELLETSVASVNSALQRARATIGDGASAGDTFKPLDETQRALLARYVQAFEAFDIEGLKRLLHEDAVLNMPPFQMWVQGVVELGEWWQGAGCGCAGSRLLPVEANGSPAFAQYRPAEDGVGWTPWGITVLEVVDGRIATMTNHMDVERLFPLWNLPMRLTEDPRA